MNSKYFSVIVVVCALILSQGCGDGTGRTVVAPGEDYQLTPAEEANLDAETKMRSGG